MSKIDTKNRILDAAEVLFAERGFADTSLRLITSEADVNLASVNYHFGSKKELIQAVLDRYLSLFMPDLDARLRVLMEQEQLTLLQLFESFVEPLMKLSAVRANGPAIFMQLLGRGYIDSQGHLRRFITAHYGPILQRITRRSPRPTGPVARGSLLAPALHPGHRRLHHGLCRCPARHRPGRFWPAARCGRAGAQRYSLSGVRSRGARGVDQALPGRVTTNNKSTETVK